MSDDLRHRLAAGRLGDDELERLLREDATLGPPPREPPLALPDLDALRARVEADLAAERGLVARLRALPGPRRAALGLLAFFGLLLPATALVHLRADLAVYPRGRMLLSLSLLAAALIAAFHQALRPLCKPPLRPAPATLLVLAGVLVPLLLALLPAEHLAHPAALGPPGAPLWRPALACLGLGLLTGVPLLALAWLLDRGAHLGGAQAALAAAAGALAGNLMLQLHCPMTAPSHLVAGHAGMAAALLAGYAAAWRMLRGRRGAQ